MRSKKGHKRSASSTETILKSFCKNPMTESSVFSISEQNFFRNNQIPNGDQTRQLLEAAKNKEENGEKEVFIESLDPELDDRSSISRPGAGSAAPGIVALTFGRKKRTLSHGSSELFYSPQSASTSSLHRALGEGYGEGNFSTNRYDLRDEPIFVIPETTNENMNSVEKKSAELERTRKIPEGITDFELFEKSPLKSKRLMKSLGTKVKSTSSSISSPSQQFSILDLHSKIKGLFDKNIPRSTNKLVKEAVTSRRNEETASLDSNSTVQPRTEKFNLVSHIRKISLGNLNQGNQQDLHKPVGSDTKSPYSKSQNTDQFFPNAEKEEVKEQAHGPEGKGSDKKLMLLEFEIANLKKKTESLEFSNAKLARKLREETKERQAIQEKSKESERKLKEMEGVLKQYGEEIKQLKALLLSKEDRGDFSEHLITTDLSMNESDNVSKKAKFIVPRIENSGTF